MASVAKKRMISLNKYGNDIFVFAFLLLKFVKYYISPDSPPVLWFRLSALLAVLTVSAVLCGALIRKTGEAQKTSLTVLLALFLASPASNDILMLDLWFRDNGTIFQYCALICAVASFFLIHRSKGKWLLPLLCFIGAALCPLFIFTLLPIPLVLAIDSIGHAADTKEKNEYKDLMASTLIASAIAFLLFGAKKAFPGVDDFPALIAENAKQTLVRAAMVLPLFAVFTALTKFIRAPGAARQSRRTALVIAMLPLLSFAGLFTAFDLGASIVMASVFAQVCLWAFFLYSGRPAFCDAAARLESFFTGNRFLLWLMLIWLAAFSGLGKIMLIGLTKSKSFFHIWQ